MAKYRFEDVKDYFLEKLANLKKVLASGNRFESAIIALCYIDALGNLFMKGRTAKEKFLNLIFSYGTVDDFKWDKVNSAEFKKIEKESKLKQNICPICYDKTMQYIEQNICQYDYSSSSICLEKDKILSEVICDIIAFSKDKTCKCNVISESVLKCLYNSTYGGILYRRYRCEGVHLAKFSEQWDSLSSRFDKPFYMDIQDSLPEFSVSSEFVIKTLECCLLNLKTLES